MIRFGVTSHLRENFNPINKKGFFGYSRKGVDFDEIREVFEDEKLNQRMVPRDGKGIEKIYFKKLGHEEIAESQGALPQRIKNHLLVEDMFPAGFQVKIPELKGFFYQGDVSDFLVEKPNMYVVSQNVEGPSFNKALKNVPRKYPYLVQIARSLIDMKSKGFYLMDFAPRDLVFNSSLYFVDFEHVDYPESCSQDLDINLIKKQVNQAKYDWEDFLEEDELNSFLRMLEGREEYSKILGKGR
jgi:hypothetical protein